MVCNIEALKLSVLRNVGTFLVAKDSVMVVLCRLGRPDLPILVYLLLDRWSVAKFIRYSSSMSIFCLLCPRVMEVIALVYLNILVLSILVAHVDSSSRPGEVAALASSRQLVQTR